MGNEGPQIKENTHTYSYSTTFYPWRSQLEESLVGEGYIINNKFHCGVQAKLSHSLSTPHGQPMAIGGWPCCFPSRPEELSTLNSSHHIDHGFFFYVLIPLPRFSCSSRGSFGSEFRSVAGISTSAEHHTRWYEFLMEFQKQKKDVL